MKRLGVLVTIFVATISIFGGFSTPEKIFAQVSPPATKPELQTKADTLFNDFIAQLLAKQNNPKQTIPSLANATDVQIASYVEGNKNLVTIVGTGKGVFGTLFSNPVAPSTNIYSDFTAGLNGASQKINTDQRATNSILRNPLLRTEVTAITYQINTLAQERQQELIAAGLQDQAGAIQNAAGVQRTAQAQEALKGVCTLFPTSNISVCITEAVTWIIKNVFLEIAGFLLWAAANVFNYSIQIGILNFSKWAPDTLYPIWIIIRQILSLLIVFVGLYLGFLYILGRDPEKFEKYIPWVVIFALFVNFSYPLARTAVDISNIVSLKIYASAVGNDALTASATSMTNSAGGKIMNSLKLQGLVASTVDISGSTGSLVKDTKSIPGALLVVAFVLYTAYVFLMATGIMIMRTVSLVFIIVASPFLLIDSVLPMLGEKAKELRKIFFEQLAVGPVFMIMLALTLKFLDVFAAASTAMGGADIGAIAEFFNLTMMLIMLHIMLKVTKSIAGEIGTYGTNAMGKVGGFGLGMATGGAGLLARGTMGAAASRMRDSSWVKNNQDTFIGKRAYDLTNSVAKSTFDLRNSTVVAGKMNKIGMGMGMGSKLGYDQAVEAKRKDTMERGARITTRHERDVYAKDGTLLNRKGDVDEAGQASKNRFIQTAGGTLLGGTRFMTKEQKKTREALGDKENEEQKKIIEDNKAKSAQDVAEYKKINKEYLRDNKMSGTPEEAKEDFVNHLEKELRDLRVTDPNLMGAQAQSLLQTIKTIKEEKRSEQAAFEKQIDAVLSTYNRKKSISENDANKYLSDQSDEINTAVQAKLNGTYIPKDTNGSVDFELPDNPSVDFEIPSSASTGKDLRAERLQKIAERRDWTVQEKEGQLRFAQTMIKASNQNIQTINKKYDDELRSLEKESSILDSNGRSVKIAPSAEEVAAVEKRRQDNLKDETKMLADFKALENKYLTAESKQQSSQAKAEQFSLNLNTASASERFAAKRKAKLAKSTAVAQQNMASNGRGSETSSSSSAPERPTPPSAPSGAARPTPQSPANDPRVAQAA